MAGEPNKEHPNTARWGGPGSSHENRDQPMPKAPDPRSPGEPTNTPFSHVSGGGGERDRHNAHDVEGKRDTQENSLERSKP